MSYSNIRQILTKDNGIASYEVGKGLVKVVSMKMYNHAGDTDDGIKDSTFVEVLAQVPEYNNPDKTGSILFTLKCTQQKGLPSAKVSRLMKQIAHKGQINLQHWIANY
jgi:hypothetical protein